jgi:peptide/nickel transport system substrate-binding protein
VGRLNGSKRSRGSVIDERLELLVLDYRAGRYTRRQVVRRAAGLGLAGAAIADVLEAAGERLTNAVPAAEAASAARTLVVGFPDNITNPDPVSPIFGDVKVLNNNITEGIVRWKTGTVTVEPALATSWEITPDGLTYAFHLRAARFHDGTLVTAEAVKTSYERQIDEKDPYHFYPMTMTEIVFSNVERIDAVDTRTIRVVQKRPAVNLLPNLALFAEGIVSPAALAKYGRDFDTHPTGSGPFMFDRWIKGVEFVETAFNGYWGGRPSIDRVIWKTVADNTVRLEQLRTGELDVATQLDFKDLPSVQTDRGLKVVSGNLLDTHYVIMNQAKAPFNKREVRFAVQRAINKANIAKVVFAGNFTIGAGPVPPGVLGYDKALSQVYTYDPAAARAAVQQSGAADTPIALLHLTEGFWPEEAQLIQSDLQAAGLNVTLQGLDQAALFGKINAADHQMYLNEWVMDTGDPDDIMFGVFSAPRRKRMGYANADVDNLNIAAQVERNPDKRDGLYVQAQRLILSDGPFVTLGYPQTAWAVKSNVDGLRVGPLGDVVIRGVRLA